MVCSFVPVFDYVDALRERERWCYCMLPPPIVPGVSLLYRYRIGWLFIYSCKQRHLTKNETTKRERRRESERDDIQSDIIRIHSRKRRHRGREMIKAKAWITSNTYVCRRRETVPCSMETDAKRVPLVDQPPALIITHSRRGCILHVEIAQAIEGTVDPPFASVV